VADDDAGRAVKKIEEYFELAKPPVGGFYFAGAKIRHYIDYLYLFCYIRINQAFKEANYGTANNS
jgi:hypothetical protein